MTGMRCVQVHTEMAEDAYKAQAEAIAPGGNLSPEGAEELKEMAEKMGISEEKAQKIVRGVTNKRLVGNLQSLKAQGELTLEKVPSSPLSAPLIPLLQRGTSVQCSWVVCGAFALAVSSARDSHPPPGGISPES